MVAGAELRHLGSIRLVISHHPLLADWLYQLKRPAHQPAHSPQLWIAPPGLEPASLWSTALSPNRTAATMNHHVNAIPVVCSFYRQKPRRQHLCIVERLLDSVVVAGAPANCLPSQDGCFTLRIHHN